MRGRALAMSAWMMLQRNLLYTAVTRADKSWYWSAADAPWPKRSGPKAPAAATPPSPNSSQGRTGCCRSGSRSVGRLKAVEHA